MDSGHVIVEGCSHGYVLAIGEVNAGVYAFDREEVARAVAGLETDNAQSEYYLTDVAAALSARGLPVAAVQLDDPSEMQGVNTRADLARAGRVLNEMVLSFPSWSTNYGARIMAARCLW